MESADFFLRCREKKLSQRRHNYMHYKHANSCDITCTVSFRVTDQTYSISVSAAKVGAALDSLDQRGVFLTVERPYYVGNGIAQPVRVRPLCGYFHYSYSLIETRYKSYVWACIIPTSEVVDSIRKGQAAPPLKIA